MAIVKNLQRLVRRLYQLFEFVKQHVSGLFAPTLDGRNEPSCAVVPGDHPPPGSGSGRAAAPGPSRGRPYYHARADPATNAPIRAKRAHAAAFRYRTFHRDSEA